MSARDRALSALLAAIAAVGLWLHLPAVTGELDRGFDGFQAAFFAGAAVNFERLGTSATHGYPLAQIDPGDDPSAWNVYTNHPRFVPHLALASLRLFGPPGWSERPGPVPPGTEAALRAPFFAFQVLTWVLIALVAWRAASPLAGWAALALAAHLPLGYAQAGLVNYEPPSVAFVVLAALLATGARGDGPAARRAALAAGATCGLGAAVTYAPVLFVPFVALACGRQRWRALLAGAAATAVALTPHVLASAAQRSASGAARSPSIVDRALEVLAPMWNGELPPRRWLAAQWEAASDAFHPALALLAVLVVGALALRLARRGGAGVDGLGRAVLALFGGALAVQVLYWRHTGDPQESFLFNAAPAAVLAVVWFGERVRRALPARAGASAAVLLTLLLVGLGSARGAAELERLRAPGPADAPGADGPSAPLPRTAAAEVAELVPEGAVVWYLDRLGLTPAVSFYAWRTLLPFRPGAYERTTALAQGLGVADRPVWLLLPREPRERDVAADAERAASDLEAFAGRPVEWREGRLYRAAPLP